MSDEDQVFCNGCRFWEPRYHGVGKCLAAGGPNARFWVAGSDEPELLTVGTFGCREFTEQAEIKKDTL